MKRVVAVGLSAFTMVVVAASTALAQADYPPDVLDQGGNTGGTGGTGGTAFTGSDVSVFAIVAVALLAIGVATLLIARRRSSAAV